LPPQSERRAGTDFVERLNGLAKKANRLKVSIDYESMMDLLRNRIAVVRGRIKAG